MPFRLTIQLENRPLRVVLMPGEHVLGSGSDCDIVVPHLTVSRHHARLRASADELWLEDLKSSNGTLVDSRRIVGEQQVREGQELGFGGIGATLERLTLEDVEAGIELLPAEPQRSAVEDSILEDSILEDSTSARRTLAGSSLEEFALRQLPSFLDRLIEGASALDAAQQIGSALFSTFPCVEIEITSHHEGQEAVWFRASGSSLPSVHSGWCEATARHIRVRAALVPKRLGEQLAPLFSTAARLILLADTARPAAVRASAGVDASELAGLAEVADPRPPTTHPELIRILQEARRVAPSDIAILILGESGTGKEVMARHLHKVSRRLSETFVAINCAALPMDLLEVELFGIEKAVATGVDARAGKFELAHEGTLFLDEIGDMAPETQAKILRVLQEGEVVRLGGRTPRPARARILSATNQDLEAMVAKGEFRRDLYYRLAGWTVELPALRERSQDIANLAAFFLGEVARRSGQRLPGISVAALEALTSHDWPGNIRQLRHEIERAALFLEEGQLLESSFLNISVRRHASSTTVVLKERLEWFERVEISRAVRRAGGDIHHAAELLGVGRSTLYRRMKVLGLSAEGGEE